MLISSKNRERLRRDSSTQNGLRTEAVQKEAVYKTNHNSSRNYRREGEAKKKLKKKRDRSESVQEVDGAG